MTRQNAGTAIAIAVASLSASTAFAGDPAELRDHIAEAAGLGFDMIQLRFAGLMDTTDIELFADEVLPHVR